MESIPANAALIIIDVQQGFDEPVWGIRNNPQAEANIATLLDTWRQTHRPVIHVQHLSRLANSPLSPGQTGNQIKASVRPIGDESIIQKQVNSAFIGTDLESRLRSQDINTLVIAGLTTDHCVSTTARMAGNLGFAVYVVADATATFNRVGYDDRHYSADEVHRLALASLHQEFAVVLDTKLVLEHLEQPVRIPLDSQGKI